MNRFEEFEELKQQLEQQQPEHLDQVYQRAEKRLSHERRKVMIPFSTLAATVVLFIGMVNFSPTFAYACGQIPLIKELAQLVAFSPSLSAAVEREYIQPIELEQTQEGITARIEYVIVDQKQLSIFYSTNSATNQSMNETPLILSLDGEALESYSISSSSFDEPNGALKHITIDFFEGNVPEGLQLILQVANNDHRDHQEAPTNRLEEDEPSTPPDYLTRFTFTLHFDPYYTAQGETIALNHIFEIDGQQLTATTVEIYPTHMRLNLADHQGNTAWLKSLSFYVENEKGQRYDAISNGITATGSLDSPMMASHRLESPFFSKSQHLTLYIDQVTWLDKDKERVKVDLVNKIAQALPQGVQFVSAVRKGDDWHLTFLGEQYRANASYQLWGWDYYDEAGNAYQLDGHSSNTGAYFDAITGKHIEVDDQFNENFILKDYLSDVVYLSPSFSRMVTLTEPVKIVLK